MPWHLLMSVLFCSLARRRPLQKQHVRTQQTGPSLSLSLISSPPQFVSFLRIPQIYRILGKMPTIAANAYRHRQGRPYNTPQQGLGYCENFLYMLDRLSEPDYRPDPRLARALDILFILHAEHELNCSTAAMRHLASSNVDPFTAVAGAAGALYGPLHGGANEVILYLSQSICCDMNSLSL